MTWERSGTCQPDVCGSACCKMLVIETNPVYQAADTANWLGLHGIDLASLGERVVARVPLVCSALNEEGRCSLYERPERPTMCGDFPRSPADLTGVEGCTYVFRRT